MSTFACFALQTAKDDMHIYALHFENLAIDFNSCANCQSSQSIISIGILHILTILSHHDISLCIITSSYSKVIVEISWHILLAIKEA